MGSAKIADQICQLVDGNSRWICKGSADIEHVLNQEQRWFLDNDPGYYPDRQLAAAAYVIKIAGGQWIEIPSSEVIMSDDPDTVY